MSRVFEGPPTPEQVEARLYELARDDKIETAIAHCRGLFEYWQTQHHRPDAVAARRCHFVLGFEYALSGIRSGRVARASTRRDQRRKRAPGEPPNVPDHVLRDQPDQPNPEEEVMQTSAQRLLAAIASVDHDALEALQVGLSLQMLARSQKTPPGTSEVYDRVGKQMVSAARLAMVRR